MDSVTAPISSITNTTIMHQIDVDIAAYNYDDDQDVCSICLDEFDSNHNPPTVSTCKHEFHLQCILEWSQRSKECPICWQVIVLKDPASQELLSMMEDERRRRSRVPQIYNGPEVYHDVEYDDSDFEEQVIRTFEVRYRRTNRERVSEVGLSPVHPNVPIGQEMYTSLEDFHSSGYVSSHDSLESSSSMATLIDQTSSPAGSSGILTPDNKDCTSKFRDLNSESLNGSPGIQIVADVHAFSESVKSKFSAASARYKESISKGTQGLKEKLLAKKTPVKELGKGVQREMSARIAGVTKIFERLDTTLKRNTDGVNSNLFKGKQHSQDNVGPDVVVMHL
ncbi:E3 ubiquitin-protein ligase RHF1A [Rutidosis leptorrhynchoides]|uniref:E3 ubiquitin-protein ligase RHF1A n=1 Tax=Rutidosis leptorrhynchoides TaxID=125765 RepID=UPI003A9A0B00